MALESIRPYRNRAEMVGTSLSSETISEGLETYRRDIESLFALERELEEKKATNLFLYIDQEISKEEYEALEVGIQKELAKITPTMTALKETIKSVCADRDIQNQI